MRRGTIMRTGGLAMRYGLTSQLATLDCTSSRRSTVMCALPAPPVTTEYQRDSSSKRPRASVVSAARAPTDGPDHVRRTASRASRPAGGACGAPGPRAPHVVGRLLCRQANACSAGAKPRSNDRDLTSSHSISASLSPGLRSRRPFTSRWVCREVGVSLASQSEARLGLFRRTA